MCNRKNKNIKVCIHSILIKYCDCYQLCMDVLSNLHKRIRKNYLVPK